jgi:hypothetical protein
MNPRLVRSLTRLYPRMWRDRYGEEFAALLEMRQGDLRIVTNSIRSAFLEHIFPTQGGNMEQTVRTFRSMLKQPSAFLPLAMSVIALAMLLGDLAIYGVAHEVAQTDEGTVAHLWQILMAGQLPIIAFFAIRWLPRAPKQSWPVLALQACAVLASMAPVYFLGL